VLFARLEGKLGRPLTDYERTLIQLPGRPAGQGGESLAADLQMMPGAARELLNVLLPPAMRWGRNFRLWGLGPPTLTPPQVLLLRAISVLSSLIPLSLLSWAVGEWQQVVAAGSQGTDPGLYYAPLAGGVATLLLPCMLWQAIDWRLACGRLGRSGLLERVVSGDTALDEICDYTPEPWRSVWMRLPQPTLEGRARLVLHYLDWFLSPPQTHFRWYWAQLALIAGVLPLLLVLCMLSSSTPLATLVNGLLGALILLPLGFLGAISGLFLPSMFFRQHLVYQLRENFGVTLDDLV
jgi:hypothetical protein